MKHVPLQPVLALKGISITELAERLDAKRNTVAAWAGRGIPIGRADEVADAAGEHAFIIWPELRDLEIAKIEKQCRCGVRFVPEANAQKWCTVECREKHYQAARQEWRRKRIASDPEFRESLNRRRREFYAETVDYSRATARRYYEAHREQVRARQAAYYEANRDEINARRRKVSR